MTGAASTAQAQPRERCFHRAVLSPPARRRQAHSEQVGQILDAGLDLVTGSRCAGCSRPGRTLCPACREQLTRMQPRLSRPDPLPPLLAGLTLMSAGPYDGLVRELIVAHKERRRLALARDLGRLLAVVTEAALASVTGPGAAVALVPVPSAPAATRARGHDPLLRITRVAAVRLRRRGTECTVARLLHQRRLVADQAGLSAAARAANLDGALVVRKTDAVANRDSAVLGDRQVLVVDDVVTTGASLAAAVSALRAAGHPPQAGVTLAATARRIQPVTESSMAAGVKDR